MRYQAFRHRTTHAYGMRLDWCRMARLVEELPELVKTTTAALEAFDNFVDSLSRSRAERHRPRPVGLRNRMDDDALML
jgi:hypothetical protein